MSLSRYRFEQKNLVLWHKIVRLELAGLEKPQIARLCRTNIRKIERTLANPYYQEWRIARVQQRSSALDRLISKDTQEMEEQLRGLIPLAIQTYEYALTHAHENIPAAIKAADSILDRDVRFTKASVPLVVEHRVNEDQLARARELAKQLKAQHTPQLPVMEAEIISETVTKPSDSKEIEQDTPAEEPAT